jgi:hypothetical protein
MNLRFVDCFFELKAEREQGGQEFRKKGVTPLETGEVVSIRFDRMEDIKLWSWIEVESWTNEPEETLPDQFFVTPGGHEKVLAEHEKQ